MKKRFLEILSSVVGAGALCGCAADLRKPFDQNFCTDGKLQFLKGISPDERNDYLARRSAPLGAGGQPVIEEEVGECGGSTNCPLLAQPVSEPGFQVSYDGSSQHLVATNDDQAEPTFMFTSEEVRAFLGTIDTVQEAALIAYVNGYDLDCLDNNVKEEESGYLVYAERGNTCGGNIKGYQLEISRSGAIEVRKSRVVEKGDKNCVIGRLPPGLCSARYAQSPKSPSLSGREAPARAVGDSTCLSHLDDAKGAFFARVAHLEAAAVAAFSHLADELEALDAPPDLIEKARKAAREETRHALLMGALSRRFGHGRPIPLVRKLPYRNAFQIALDNAVEGLARETFGALLGLHQAERTPDAQLRVVMQLIAHDEAGHAEFSWELHRFVMTRLSSAQQQVVERAHTQAVAHFEPDASDDLSAELRDFLGLPSRQIAVKLHHELFFGQMSSLS